MIPDVFWTRCPHLSAALAQMLSSQGEDSAYSRTDLIAAELRDLIDPKLSIGSLVAGFLEGVAAPEVELARVGAKAYQLLGVSDDVRTFVGEFWAIGASSLAGPQLGRFLQLTVEDRHGVFESLDFAPELIRRVRASPIELFRWVKKARAQVGNDFMQGGLWTSIETLSRADPSAAITVVDLWLDEHPSDSEVSAIGSMVGWIRLELIETAANRDGLTQLEKRLCSTANTAGRSAYIQSFARAVGHPSLDIGVLRNVSRVLTTSRDEDGPWCYLLHAVYVGSVTSAELRQYVLEELLSISRSELSATAQHWAFLTTLAALSNVDEVDGLLERSPWAIVLSSLAPISQLSGAWTQVERTLINLSKAAPRHLNSLIELLGAHSGGEWLAVLNENRFQGFLRTLRDGDQLTQAATLLCLSESRECRRLGMKLVELGPPGPLDETAVERADPERIELLILEAQRHHMDYASLAWLHAAVAKRVEAIGNGLPDLFYEEVATQCRNTHGYRRALRQAAPTDVYLMAIVDDSEERLRETRAAIDSPALRLDVPGFSRAVRLHDRKMALLVAKSVAKHSVLISLMKKTQLIYGNSGWRHFNSDGTLSPSANLHTTSADIEIPQLEILDPEGAKLRRLKASVRIAELDRKRGQSA